MPWYELAGLAVVLWLVVALVVGTLFGHAASLATLHGIHTWARGPAPQVDGLDIAGADADSGPQRPSG